MSLRGKNITFAHLIEVEETCIYSESLEKPEQ